MKHEITRYEDKIQIRLTGIGNDGKHFDGVSDCTHIVETCGQENYRTLDSFEARSIADGVHFELKARPDAVLDLEEAEQCLDNAMERIIAGSEKAMQV